MTRTIYLVEVFDGNFETPKKAFSDKDKAEEFMGELKKKYENVFEDEIWDVIMGEYDDASFKDPEKYDNNEDYRSDKWNEREDEVRQIKLDFLLESLHNHGFTAATVEDVKKQLEYIEYNHEDYNCYIREIDMEDETYKPTD